MTILTNIPNGASLKDTRDTMNSVLARVLALEGNVGTPTPSPTPSPSPTPAPTPTPSPTPSPTPAAPIASVVFVGTSIGEPTDGSQTGMNRKAYVEWWRAANPSVETANMCLGGRDIGIPSDRPEGGNRNHWTQFNAVKAQLLSMPAPRALFFHVGENANALDDPNSTTWISSVNSYLDTMHAEVPGAIIFVADSLPMTGSPANPSNNTNAIAYNNARRDKSAALRSGVGAHADAFVAMGSGRTYGPDAAAQDPILVGDLIIHPAGEGRIENGRKVAAVLDPAVAGASGNTPTAFDLPAQINVPLSTAVTVWTTITGMGIGQKATVTCPPGFTIARGYQAFGTTSIEVTNGDDIGLRWAGSASNAATASATLNIGSRSAVWNVGTVPATAVGFTPGSTHYRHALANGSGPYTFNADFPAGRPIIGLDVTYSAYTTGVTINGVAAVQLPGTNMWVGPHTQTLTAGPRTVTISMSLPYYTGIIIVGALTNYTKTAVQIASAQTRIIPLNGLDFPSNFGGTRAVDGEALTATVGSLILSYAVARTSVANVTLPDEDIVFTSASYDRDENSAGTQMMTARWATSRLSHLPRFRSTGGLYVMQAALLEL